MDSKKKKTQALFLASFCLSLGLSLFSVLPSSHPTSQNSFSFKNSVKQRIFKPSIKICLVSTAGPTWLSHSATPKLAIVDDDERSRETRDGQGASHLWPFPIALYLPFIEHSLLLHDVEFFATHSGRPRTARPAIHLPVVCYTSIRYFPFHQTDFSSAVDYLLYVPGYQSRH